MLTQHSDLISLSLVALTEVLWRRDHPNIRSFIHDVKGKSLSHTWLERIDNETGYKCVLLVWRISEAQWVMFIKAKWQIYMVFRKELNMKGCLKWLLMHWNGGWDEMNVLNGVCFPDWMIILVFKYLRINCLRKSNQNKKSDCGWMTFKD